MVLRAAALALTATVAVKVLLNKLGFRFWRDYGGLDGIVSFSSRLIAAARAVESEEQHHLISDPLAAVLAGSDAIAASHRRAQKAPKGSCRKHKIGMMAIRTKWFDDQLEAALGMPVEAAVPEALVDDDVPASSETYIWRPPQDAHKPHQVVMLGAGMDARPWRMKLPAELKWFEVDRADVLAVKRRVLAAAGVEVPDAGAAGEARGGILRQSSLDKVDVPLRTGDWAGVAADLSSPTWADSLQAAGFDPHKPTVWVAEGLLMYLQPEAVDSVLKQAADLSAPGSAFLCLSVTDEVISDLRTRGSRSELMQQWVFGLPAGSAAEFFEARGWQLQLTTDRTRMAEALRLRCELCTFVDDAGNRRAARSLFMVASVKE